MAEECCWAITQLRDSRAAANQSPGCWNMDSNWTASYIYIIIRILYSDLHKIRLELDIPECNYCVIGGVSVLSKTTKKPKVACAPSEIRTSHIPNVSL